MFTKFTTLVSVLLVLLRHIFQTFERSGRRVDLLNKFIVQVSFDVCFMIESVLPNFSLNQLMF